MIDREKVIKGLECCSNSLDYQLRCNGCPYYSDCQSWNEDWISFKLIADALELLKEQEPITGETSDGYHTFNELYHHRAVLFSVIVANYPERAWKSKKHNDGTMYDGMFIVGIETPDGQATYHYDIDPYWEIFKCRVLDKAPEWDGHTPAQAIERIGKLKGQEPRVLTWDELMALPHGEETNAPVVSEVKYPIGTWDKGTICKWRGAEFLQELVQDHHWYNRDTYNKIWRCWTAFPSKKQRKEAKWDE